VCKCVPLGKRHKFSPSESLLYNSFPPPSQKLLFHLHHQRRVEYLLSFPHAPAPGASFTFTFTLFQFALLPKPPIHSFADLLIQVHFHSFNSAQRPPQSSQGTLVSSCSLSLDGELQLRQQFTAFTTHHKSISSVFLAILCSSIPQQQPPLNP
jgi:hypothetical protein